jgi:diphosphomevalonate decarboxylase
MTEKDFISKSNSNLIESGRVTWESPSNIALVKYWGKKEGQIPANPSISFTLNTSKTKTTLSYSKKEDQSNFDFEVYLDGVKKDDFKPKIQTFFERIELYLPFFESV